MRDSSKALGLRLDDLADDKRAVVEAALRSEEHLRWLGQPNPVRFGNRMLPGVPMGLFWLGIAVGPVITGASIEYPNDLLSVASWILYLAAGFALTLSPWLARAQTRQTLYAVTDRRALVFSPFGLSNLGRFGLREAYSLSKLKDRQVFSWHDGSGNITFPNEKDSESNCHGFNCIDNVRAVDGLLEVNRDSMAGYE